MTEEHKQSIAPLVLMLVVYGVMIAASVGVSLLGLAFGSEAYRDRGIPIAELLPMLTPLVISLSLFIGTLLLWNAQRYCIAYIICASCLGVMLHGLFGGFGLYL